MRQPFFSLCIALFVLFVRPALADSPLTSTPFYQAYLDVPEVQAASNSFGMDRELASYLLDPETPLDRAAAAINALGNQNQNNADALLEILPEVNRTEGYNYAIGHPSARLSFIIGYLRAMDDYFEVDDALRQLRQAEQGLEPSLTVSLITALVEVQDVEVDEWCLRWEIPDAVRQRFSGREDMREEALAIIFEYQGLYADECPGAGGAELEQGQEAYRESPPPGGERNKIQNVD